MVAVVPWLDGGEYVEEEENDDDEEERKGIGMDKEVLLLSLLLLIRGRIAVPYAPTRSFPPEESKDVEEGESEKE